ncbi:GMC family oxidoreductase [Streptomyces scopuliridis]|uniref:GMC family oxidoreductase n=1 Tax=Streptomyces scopuliridis TaxID=452529 RepID=UPI003413C810
MPQSTSLGPHLVRNWDELPDRADILIVGGGLAGLELAKHLELAGAGDVLVVEAGAGDDLQHVYAANDTASADRIWTDEQSDEYFVRLWNSATEPHFAQGSGLRRRVGGRSLYWHGVLLPVEDWALADPAWPDTVVNDLAHSWQGGASLYERVRSELMRWSQRGETSTAAPDDTTLKVGRFRLVDPPRAVRPAGPGSLRWEAYSPLSHWLESDPAMNSAGEDGRVHITPDVETVDVLTSQGRAEGVVVRHRVSGEEKRIAAGKVVLAAGTVESSRLAIQALNRVGKLAESRLTGLVDHVVQGFNVTLTSEDLPEWLVSRARQGIFSFTPGSGSSHSNLFVQLDLTTAGDLQLEVWATGEQIRSAHGVVSCAPTEEGPWPVTISTGLDSQDALTVEAQRDELQEFWSAWCAEFGLKSVPLAFDFSFTAPTRTLRSVRELLRTEDLPLSHHEPVTWSSPLGTEEHEGGTLAIGDVLNESQEFIEIADLFAVGPAIFPRQGSANPSLTSLALSRRLAAILTA